MIVDFMIALLATIFIEEVIAYTFGFRKKEFLLLVALVNIITNPLLNYVLLWIAGFSVEWIYYISILLLEMLVVYVEWRLLCYGLRQESKRLLKLSFVMNAGSLSIGLIFYMMINTYSLPW